MEVGNTGQMSAPGFTVSASPTSQTFITLVTTTSSSTTQILISTAFQTVTVSATASPDSHDSNTDRAWIAGAVLGPVVLLLILLTGAFFIWRRRRRVASRASALTTESIPSEDKSQKPPSQSSHPAELHEDTIPPQPQELYGSLPEAPSIIEKPTHTSGPRTARERTCARIAGKRHIEGSISHNFAIYGRNPRSMTNAYKKGKTSTQAIMRGGNLPVPFTTISQPFSVRPVRQGSGFCT